MYLEESCESVIECWKSGLFREGSQEEDRGDESVEELISSKERLLVKSS